jgi:hypothetical protein
MPLIKGIKRMIMDYKIKRNFIITYKIMLFGKSVVVSGLQEI